MTEYCIANTVFKYWNGIAPGYIHKIVKPLLCRYSTRWHWAYSAEYKYRAKICDEERITKLIKKVFEDRFKKRAKLSKNNKWQS